ncbi:MAG TPA: efflux RND transporter periplasmic adaptor subunit [Planctomycetota bacterium]|nr:efflux RND transporter periplasmic adaptor subunit [Planctomycetota bacterium]
MKYYWDPMMKPPYISDKPGKSPMGMDLIPVYEDEVRAGPTVTIDPIMTQNIGIRTAPVEEGPLFVSVRTVGYFREAEPRQRDITLKVGGWIDKLHADTEGIFVKKGAPLFDLYSPELLVAQEELLTAVRALDRLSKEADSGLRTDRQRLVESARRKLSLWDVPAETIDAILREGAAQLRITFVSPSDGYVVEKRVVQGSAVEAGMKLFRIVDQSILWLDAQIYEAQLPSLALGQKAKAIVSSLPGRDFEGEVVYISPSVHPATRTAVARLSFPNPNLVLKPGMYATIDLRVRVAGRTLIVPREAVLETGVRQIAFVARDGGHFDPRIVRVGAETGDGRVQILEGLAPGEKVVTSGQFLLDAESRMREAIQKMTGENLLHPPPPAKPEEKSRPSHLH